MKLRVPFSIVNEKITKNSLPDDDNSESPHLSLTELRACGAD